MNRDIKFRGFDSVNKVMLPVESINFREGYISLNEGDNSVTDTLEMIELMRYTGLKDRNGKEIYEGDIVRFYNDEEYKLKPTNALVIYESAAFMLEHKKLGKEYLGEMDIENMCIKILGNIYDNPELLEGE